MKVFILLVLLLISNTLKSQTNKDQYIGIWENTNKSIQIEIFKNDYTYSGKIVKINIEKYKKNVGDKIIMSMRRRRDNVLYGGTYYDIEKNKEYEIKIKLVNTNHFFIKRPHRFFSKIENWYRIIN